MPTAATIAAAFALLLLAAPAGAKDAVKVTGAAVGFPAARDDSHVAKFGAWAPVYVQLELLADVTEPAELVFESPDPDETTVVLTVPIDLTGLAPGTTLAASERGAFGYVRPGGGASEVTVTVRTASGTALSEPFRARIRPREPLAYVVLALGGAPAGFELPKPPGAPPEAGSLRAGRVELARVASVAQLPDAWYGYEAADLVVLNTGTTPDFLQQLFGEPANERKREALLEWVRRGGRVVTAVGANAALAAQLPALQPLLPFALKAGAATRQVDVLGLVEGEKNRALGTLGDRTAKFPVANLVARPGGAAPALVLTPERPGEERQAVVAQHAVGLGRATVVGFDLDGPPFADFAARPEFWDFVLREGGADRASGGDGKPRAPGGLSEDEDEAAVALRAHNDTFDGVPVVSFGWVALLIVLYILLVGPVEYYFLKRVLGRLELTWVTLPVIVLTVSALAYVSASAVKGRDLKVNKIDVVDVDPASGRIYGTTWFTVFSPRIDSYSVGITPNDGWAAEELPDGTVIASTGAPRAGRAGLTRRRYTIRERGLENVPIPVWSTKAFTANWSARLETGSDSRFDSDLVHPPGAPTKAIGSFVHNLPVPELTDCVAFYAGRAYPLPGEVIVRGGRVRLVLDQGTPAGQWLQANAKLEPLLTRVQAYAERPGQKNVQRQQQMVFTGPLPLTGVLFHEGALRNDEGVTARNASLRRLDQSWRLSEGNRAEVIVVGRAAPPLGASKDVLTGPYAPSKLWLKSLPGAGAYRDIPGTARQETWVRFYIPVK